MKSIISILVLFLAQTSFASLLTLEPGTKSVENVNVANSAVVTVDGQSTKVDSLGVGLRAKKVAILNVKVYVGQVFGSDASKFVRTNDGALDSTSNMSTTAVQMTFLRDVTAAQISSSLEEAFALNKVDVTRPEVKAVLAAANQDVLTGKTLTFACEKLTDGSELVTVEANGANATSVKGPAGFSHDVMSMWLGVVGDSGVQAFKDQVIKGN